MAISQEQADTANVFHAEGECTNKRGPVRWRRNGTTQRWKRDVERFRVPLKHGLYNFFQMTNDNAHLFHTGADCPVAPEGHN